MHIGTEYYNSVDQQLKIAVIEKVNEIENNLEDNYSTIEQLDSEICPEVQRMLLERLGGDFFV